MALTDADGVPVERTWYEAYGNSTCRRESDGDEQTGSHYAKADLSHARGRRVEVSIRGRGVQNP